ncbi:MAG: hypothetical protein P8175_19400 [Deltaproteobacteria bacterium]
MESSSSKSRSFLLVEPRFPTLTLDSLVHQVLHNCSISDARYAGCYSICGLALRLRDLYKWEKGLDPWVEEESSTVLNWIGNKEEEWEKVARRAFAPINILGRSYDAFDTAGINRILEPLGLYYGAGYVHSLKPCFFLARLDEKRWVDGFPAYYLGRELARDLLTVPAFSQDDRILIRKESAKLFLWDKIFFVKKSGRAALKFALKSYGLEMQDAEALQSAFAFISEDEAESYVHHELGEIRDTDFDRLAWQDMIATFPHTPIELFIRSVKDMLADTNEYGRLRYITREKKLASLGFFAAFLDGLRKELFPEFVEAFMEFAETRDWHVIEKTVSVGYRRAKSYTETICGIYEAGKKNNDMQGVASEIEKQLLIPLGIITERG